MKATWASKLAKGSFWLGLHNLNYFSSRNPRVPCPFFQFLTKRIFLDSESEVLETHSNNIRDQSFSLLLCKLFIRKQRGCRVWRDVCSWNSYFCSALAEVKVFLENIEHSLRKTWTLPFIIQHPRTSPSDWKTAEIPKCALCLQTTTIVTVVELCFYSTFLYAYPV